MRLCELRPSERACQRKKRACTRKGIIASMHTSTYHVPSGWVLSHAERSKGVSSSAGISTVALPPVELVVFPSSMGMFSAVACLSSGAACREACLSACFAAARAAALFATLKDEGAALPPAREARATTHAVASTTAAAAAVRARERPPSSSAGRGRAAGA